MLELIKEPWPWYIAGPLVGLTVPALLIIGNKSFGISASLRHTCAICLPANIAFFKYDWKKEIWNMFFVLGILIGGVIAYSFLSNPDPIIINANLKTELAAYGITNINGMLPEQLFSWENLFSLKGFFMMVIGGFFIAGLSNLQWPSLIATCCFFVGGLIMANLILPLILSL
ncbi:MAG: YeeE/YedE family protein [bacterium]|nr:YeeE/YedE family protein [bacterium]